MSTVQPRRADSAAATTRGGRAGSGRTGPDTKGPGNPLMFAGLTGSAAIFAGLLLAAAALAAIVATGATQPQPVSGLETSGPVVEFGIPVARTLLDLGAAATVGVALLARLVGFDRPEKTEPVMRRARWAGLWASVLWTVAALVSIVLLTAELQPGSVPSPAAIWSYLSNIPAGKGLLLSAGCGLVSVWLGWLTIRHGESVPAELRAGVALFGLLPLPLTGHASNWVYHDLGMVSMELHVVAATAWAGALGAVIIFLSRRPDLLAIALPRYSKLATWCVFLVGTTGLFNGLVELALSPVTSLPSSLWMTRYGVLLLTKAVLIVVIAAVAIVVRTRLLPRIAAGRRTAVAVWCGWELIVLALAFAVAVVLTRVPVTSF
ncbi:MAG TPA: CopD family protein [Nakamurella sp.]